MNRKVVPVVQIWGENRHPSWTKTRTACRGVVAREGLLLLSCLSRSDTWMLPGGGLEPGEGETDCCRRELAEETGLLVEPAGCVLEIDEFYEEWKFVSRYYICAVTGATPPRLTAAETALGLVPRWLPVGEARALFSRHREFADTDEMKRGLYLREDTALRELTERGYLT